MADLPVAPGVTVRTAVLPPSCLGLWDQHARTVWLDERLSPAERRSTLAHELVHAERGDVPCGDPCLDARQERRVDREAARRLIAVEALADALRWTRDPREVAELLDVDVALLAARIEALTPTERAQLRSGVAVELVA